MPIFLETLQSTLESNYGLLNVNEGCNETNSLPLLLSHCAFSLGEDVSECGILFEADGDINIPRRLIDFQSIVLFIPLTTFVQSDSGALIKS